VSGCADLIADGRHYAGAALVRQLVEVEYLAWAFETKDEESAKWLRSRREEREQFFKRQSSETLLADVSAAPITVTIASLEAIRCPVRGDCER
jgi:hypothetical protein